MNQNVKSHAGMVLMSAPSGVARMKLFSHAPFESRWPSDTPAHVHSSDDDSCDPPLYDEASDGFLASERARGEWPALRSVADRRHECYNAARRLPVCTPRASRLPSAWAPPWPETMSRRLVPRRLNRLRLFAGNGGLECPRWRKGIRERTMGWATILQAILGRP